MKMSKEGIAIYKSVVRAMRKSGMHTRKSILRWQKEDRPQIIEFYNYLAYHQKKGAM